ncbi:unnamed protein product [Caretta caretta]
MAPSNPLPPFLLLHWLLTSSKSHPINGHHQPWFLMASFSHPTVGVADINGAAHDWLQDPPPVVTDRIPPGKRIPKLGKGRVPPEPIPSTLGLTRLLLGPLNGVELAGS